MKTDESYWVIPGGQVEPGENHERALKRECMEEIGVEIRVNKLFMQRTSDKPGMEEQREFFYLCDIISGDLGTGQGPEFEDKTQYEGEYKISWVNLKNLSDTNLRPQEVKDRIIKDFLTDR